MNNKKCKYFHHEPYWTPNNYDIYINQSSIPSNVPRENLPNLFERLQKLMPLGKIIHINFDTEPSEFSKGNAFMMNTVLKINNKQVKFK